MPEKKLPAQPKIKLVEPVERMKIVRPVERMKIIDPVEGRIKEIKPVVRIRVLRDIKRGPIDTEPGQPGQGWDAGTYLNPSPIGDDAGAY